MTARASTDQLKIHVMESRDVERETGVCRKCGPVSMIWKKGFWRCESQAPQRVKHRLAQKDIERRTAVCVLCGPTTLVRKHGRWACESMQLDTHSTHLRERYGITVEQYDALFEKQGGKCAICREDTGRLHIDHEHSTGRVRGLLCGNCNRGLGVFKDDPKRLRAAADYLEEARRDEDHSRATAS